MMPDPTDEQVRELAPELRRVYRATDGDWSEVARAAFAHLAPPTDAEPSRWAVLRSDGSFHSTFSGDERETAEQYAKTTNRTVVPLYAGRPPQPEPLPEVVEDGDRLLIDGEPMSTHSSADGWRLYAEAKEKWARIYRAAEAHMRAKEAREAEAKAAEQAQRDAEVDAVARHRAEAFWREHGMKRLTWPSIGEQARRQWRFDAEHYYDLGARVPVEPPTAEEA